jgi:hypothetical protein
MSVKAINPVKLRTDLSKEIDKYRARAYKKKITFEEMEVLLEKLLNERSILLNEFDAFKERQVKNLPSNLCKEDSLNLLLDEIDEFLYNDFYNLAKRLGYSGPGEILNQLMNDFISRYDGAFPDFSAKSINKLLLKELTEISVNHQEQLTINQKDLLELSDTCARINFNHIETLEFSNVDLDTFTKYVGSINHCTIVRIPEDFPKLLLYAKCHNCTYFEFNKTNQPNLDSKKIEYVKEANYIVEDWKNNGT